MATAAQAGYEIPDETLTRAAEYWLKNQLENGGWTYVGRVGQTTATMTLSGIACLAMIDEILEDKPLRQRIVESIQRAWSVPDLQSDIQSHPQWRMYGWQIFMLAKQSTQENKNIQPLTFPKAEEVLAEFEKLQRADGSLAVSSIANRAYETCLALLALAEEQP